MSTAKKSASLPLMNASEGLSSLLIILAQKYIWWKTPDEALRFPKRIMAQVMELGDYQEVLQLTETAGVPALREVIQTAEAGWFSPENWHFWHYRLGLCAIGQVPPLPRKRIPGT